MTAISTRAIAKSFGAVSVLKDISIDIEDGEFVVVVGPSGCGKSTFLRVLSGLEDATSGHILFDGQDVTDLTPGKRKVAMVFQSYALYPHMTVAENIGFATRVHGRSKSETEAKVAEIAATLRLTEHLDRRPAELSGGQKQRVAIGRAIIREPGVFLFDEPLSNLDAELRVGMRLELSELHKRLGRTMIYVTHDQVEAMTLADRIVILRDGGLEQMGTPKDLYRNPDNVFVAGFLGTPKISFLNAVASAEIDGKTYASLQSDPEISIELPVNVAVGSEVIVGVRPESLGQNGQVELPLIPRLVEDLGGSTIAYCRTPGGSDITVQLPSQSEVVLGKGTTVALNPTEVLVFDAANGERMR